MTASPVLLLLPLLLAGQARAVSVPRSCACELSGSGGLNPCASTQVVVRPAPMPAPQGPLCPGPRIVCHKLADSTAPNFKPVGDVCNCDRTIVLPADQLRPVCDACARREPHPPSIPTLADETPCPYPPPKPGRKPVPADPVSVGLVLSQQQERAIREDVLSYGPRCMPKSAPLCKEKPHGNVIEEGLQSFDKQVVELRAPKGGSEAGCVGITLEEEPLEALDCADDLPPATHLSYADLGYVPATGREPHFVPQHTCHSEHVPPPEETFSLPLPCPCEQPAGRVLVSEGRPRLHQTRCPYACDEDDDLVVPPGAYVLPAPPAAAPSSPFLARIAAAAALPAPGPGCSCAY